MILLDTDLLIEAMKPVPETAIVTWLDAQPAESLYISTISVAELLAGVGFLADGRVKDGVSRAVERMLQVFGDRVLAFDTIAAFAYADIVIRAKRGGLGHAMPDVLLAAIAAGHGMTIASRRPDMFESIGRPVIDPSRR